MRNHCCQNCVHVSHDHILGRMFTSHTAHAATPVWTMLPGELRVMQGWHSTDRPTHRGCRPGAHKRRNISVITSRLTTLTKTPVTCRGNNNIQVPCGKWDLSVVVNTNIKSVVPKITELSKVLKLNCADIAPITETWCRDHIPDETICVPGYFHIRKDRADRRGGRVMVLCKTWQPFQGMERTT